MSLADELKKSQTPEARYQRVKEQREFMRRADAELDAAKYASREPLRALTVQELFDRPAPDYIVDKLLPVGALAELVGDSETLKSFIAIHLGMAIASCQPDFFGLPVMKHGPVLYIAAEGAGSFQFRLRAWGTAHGVDIRAVPFHTIASPVNLRDETFQGELQAIVNQIRPVAIFVDTLHRCIPGAEENSSRDLGEVVGFASRLQAETGACVLFLHHPPKSDPTGRGRGSGVLYYAADTEIGVTLEGAEQPNGTKVIVAAVKKQKDDAKVSLTLTNCVVPVLNEHGRPMAYTSGRAITSCVLVKATEADVNTAREASSTQVEKRVLDYVRANPGKTAPEIREGIRVGSTAANAALDDLVQQQVLMKETEKRGRTKATVYHESIVAAAPAADVDPGL
jgi:hypothetical protein